MRLKVLRVRALWLGIGSGAAGFALGHRLAVPQPGETPAVSPPTVEQVRQLASLVTTRVEVADVQETVVEGYTGGMRVALLVRGDFLMGVDLSQAKFESVDASARTATLVLPAPRAASPRVDHARTRLFEVRDEGLWVVVPGDGGRSRVVDRAYGRAQRAVGEAATDPALVQRSKLQAEQVLTAFFGALGWTIRVRWTG